MDSDIRHRSPSGGREQAEAVVTTEPEAPTIESTTNIESTSSELETRAATNAVSTTAAHVSEIPASLPTSSIDHKAHSPDPAVSTTLIHVSDISTSPPPSSTGHEAHIPNPTVPDPPTAPSSSTDSRCHEPSKPTHPKPAAARRKRHRPMVLPPPYLKGQAREDYLKDPIYADQLHYRSLPPDPHARPVLAEARPLKASTASVQKASANNVQRALVDNSQESPADNAQQPSANATQKASTGHMNPEDTERSRDWRERYKSQPNNQGPKNHREKDQGDEKKRKRERDEDEEEEVDGRERKGQEVVRESSSHPDAPQQYGASPSRSTSSTHCQPDAGPEPRPSEARPCGGQANQATSNRKFRRCKYCGKEFHPDVPEECGKSPRCK
ncbi:hypothetical protein K449DRAFT_99312 [Hypoxylon sp. EC38]|nr:hypothetical protein K449DRAFT_99312 [Hypoxylon sp. EC38]